MNVNKDMKEVAVSKNTCCGGPAPQGENACCMKDFDAKAAGEKGCGCKKKEDL